MIRAITVESHIHFTRRGRGGRKEVRSGAATVPTLRPTGRVPRVARLMARAIRFDELIHAGEVADYAELARLAHVSRARITQIMNLRMLAPDIQEAVLFLGRVERGQDSIHLRELQPIALIPDWRRQRRMWHHLAAHAAAS